MKNILTNHIARILNISEEDAGKWIENDKIIRKYLKSKDTVVNVEEQLQDEVAVKKSSSTGRSIFILNGEETRLETVFHLWFERTGNKKKAETIERYLDGKSKARKGLKGYLKSTSIENTDTFVLLFNLLIEGNLELNGGSE